MKYKHQTRLRNSILKEFRVNDDKIVRDLAHK